MSKLNRARAVAAADRDSGPARTRSRRLRVGRVGAHTSYSAAGRCDVTRALRLAAPAAGKVRNRPRAGCQSPRYPARLARNGSTQGGKAGAQRTCRAGRGARSSRRPRSVRIRRSRSRCRRSRRPRRRRSGGALVRAPRRACTRSRRPIAGRSARSSTRPPIGFASRRSSPRAGRRAPSTRSRCRRSSPTRRSRAADQAWRIRALGPNFHALAEISINAWSPGSRRPAAPGTRPASRRAEAHGGGRLRRRAGRLVGAERALVGGAPRRRRRRARTCATFVRGLYTGDGSLPAARGAVVRHRDRPGRPSSCRRTSRGSRTGSRTPASGPTCRRT